MAETKAFKPGGQPHKLNEYLKQGKSLTHDEAAVIGIGRLAQRVKDVHERYMDLTGESPMMVYTEPNTRGGTHARYFYKGAGSSFESKPNVRAY